MSATTTSPAPAASSSLMIAVPAAPAPEMTILTSLICLPTTRRALSNAARTTIAVPCWSSWNTGMSSCSRSRRAAQVTSIRRRSCPDAVTSSAVIAPPACSTAVVSWEAARPPAGTSSRTVIEYDTDGAPRRRIASLTSAGFMWSPETAKLADSRSRRRYPD
jgi:hypothetical protein